MLSKYQIKLLRKVNKERKVNIENASETEISAYTYLKTEGYVEIEEKTHYITEPGYFANYTVPINVEIAEKGTAYLSESKSEYSRYIIPLIINSLISVGAIVVSLIALIGG